MHPGTLRAAVAPVLLSLLGLLGMAAGVAQAAVVIEITEQAGDVVASASGTLNLSALTPSGNGSQPGFVNPSLGVLMLPGSTSTFDVYGAITNPPNSGIFGSGDSTLSTSATGDFLAVVSLNNTIRVPTGYISGTALSSTATWSNTTIAGLGATEGSYVWSWGSGGTADSITMNISVAPVPEPTAGALAVVSLVCGGIVVLARRRQGPLRVA